MKRLITLLAMAGVLAVSGQVFGADTGKGNLKYSITVSKFENRAGWSGQWDIGDAWGAVQVRPVFHRNPSRKPRQGHCH